MKHLFIVLLLAFTAGKATAQTELQLHPVHTVADILVISADQILEPELILSLSCNYSNNPQIATGKRFGARLQSKYFHWLAEDDQPATGWWLGPYASYNLDLEDNDDDATEKRHRYILGFGTGYKALFKTGLVIEASIGFGRALYTENHKSYMYKVSLDTYIGLGIGYRFGH